MATYRVDRLDVAVLDGQVLDDATLARLVPECRSLTAFTTSADSGDLEHRWQALAPHVELIDGGHVADVRAALIECGRRSIVVLATGVPADAPRFVGQALQGAAAMTEFGVPGVAVHVMRPDVSAGSVAWLTDTGSLSGYGVLFAIGYAHLHGTGVDLIEPTGGLELPRTGKAMEDALAFAERAGVPITRHTDPSPFARVIRDEHCLVVHPVLDAPRGFNLLHPGELSNKAVASGNPAVVVDLLEQFPGDVVAVFDGVHLLSGAIPAARIAAGVALGVVAAAGIGTMVASPAAAAGNSSSSQHERGNDVDVSGHVPGISYVAAPHGHGETTLTLRNMTDHAISVTVTGGHGHEGGGAGAWAGIVPAHGFKTITLGGGVKQWTVSAGQEQQQSVAAQQHVVAVGTAESFTDHGPVPQVVVAEPTTETELETVEPGTLSPPRLEVPTPEVTVVETPSFTGSGQPPVREPVLEPTVVVPVVVQVPEGQPPRPLVQPPVQPVLEPTLLTTVVSPQPDVLVQPPRVVEVTSPDLTAPELTSPTQPQTGPQTQTQTPVTDTAPADVVVGVSNGTATLGTTLGPAGADVATPNVATTSGHVGDHAVRHQTPTHHHSEHVTASTRGGSSTGVAGELAHTGGSTAVLAIVAGSLIAAGAGMAFVGRAGKDEPDVAAPEA